MNDVLKGLIRTHFEELKQEYPNFRLTFREKDAVVTGLLEFYIASEKEQIAHEYHVSMYIPIDYPNNLPSVTEFSGKVPTNFHVNPTGQLCLGVASDLWFYLEGKLTLSRFTKRCVIPFFLSLQQKQQTGKVNQGERPHGSRGIQEFFKDYFSCDDTEKLLRILCAIYYGLLDSVASCPCGNNKTYEDCCKQKVDLLLEFCPQNVIRKDILIFFHFHYKEKEQSLLKNFFSSKMKNDPHENFQYHSLSSFFR